MSDIELLAVERQENHQSFRAIDVGRISTIQGIQCVAIDTIPQFRRVTSELVHNEGMSQGLLARESAVLPEQFYEMRLWTEEALKAFKQLIAEMGDDEIFPLRAFESRIGLSRNDFENIRAKMPYLEILALPVSQMPGELIHILKDVVSSPYTKEIHFIAPDLKWYQFFLSYHNFLPKNQIRPFEAFACYCVRQLIDVSYAGKRIAWMTPSEKAAKYLLWFLFTVSWASFAVNAFGLMLYDSLEESEVHTLDEYLQEIKYKKIAFWAAVFSPIGVFVTLFLIACAEYYPKKARYEKLDDAPFELPEIVPETV